MVSSLSSSSEQHNKSADVDWLEEDSDSSELNRESEAREQEFRLLGYRDGIIAGKESSAQEGFNDGFKKAALGGLKWGFLKGATSVLVGLPDHLKVKLAENVVDKDRLWEFCETIRSTSSSDVSRKCNDDSIAGQEGFDRMEQQYEEFQSLLCELGDFKLPKKDKANYSKI